MRLTAIEEFLRPTRIVDWQAAAVREQAARLAEPHAGDLDIARTCFEWVRDAIPHTGDHELNPVICVASEVLERRTGFCYAKGHLLAALLRANGIPAGFVYQRLSLGDGRFGLHGLNAAFLPQAGWYRLDARGRRPDLVSEFAPPVERLPFAADAAGERLFAGVWADPVPVVVAALERHRRRADLIEHLPDALDLGPPDAEIGVP